MSDTALNTIDDVIRYHSAYVEKRFHHMYRDYEKRHLRWKHDKQDGIEYAEPTAPDRDTLAKEHTIPVTLHLLKAIRAMNSHGVQVDLSAGNV